MQLFRALAWVGDAAQAIALCLAAHDAFRERFGPDSHFTAIAARTLAAVE